MPNHPLIEKFQSLYQRHHVLVSAIVFLSGFLIDVFTLGDIDDTFSLIQQFVYLCAITFILYFELIKKTPKFFAKYWEYRELAIQFLFGSLLSIYTLYFFHSASQITGFLFICLLGLLLVANEFPQFQRLEFGVKFIVLSLCTISYLLILFPILFGHISIIGFFIGVLSSLAIFLGLYFLHKDHIGDLKKKYLYPIIGTHIFFVFAYFLNIVPPVPIAVKHIGVYHNIEKLDGIYRVSFLPRKYLFWLDSNSDFSARPEDSLNIFVQIFSPRAFEDKVFLEFYKDGQKQDRIPIGIRGGRSEGFRGYVTKKNYSPGNWQVVVMSSDNRPFGNYSFKVHSDTTTEIRDFKVLDF